MSYQVLARKLRPKSFNEVVGQDHITRALSNAVKNNKIAHAYLLAGTRGVGKTTIARIFAKALCCENLDKDSNPCGTCSSCVSIQDGTSLDYFEADGASNNKVENIRDIIESVHYLPTQGKYKVYVIDEVHMLTTNAFNALLKTLEEPPEHVIFIFATTDPQKLLGTVLSRCQRFDFKALTTTQLESYLADVVKNEGLSFENARGINTICSHGKGSVRDTLSLLDQVISLSTNNVITDEIINDSLGLVNDKFITDLLDSIMTGNVEVYKTTLDKINQQNVDLKVFGSQLQNELFNAIQGASENTNNTLISDESLSTIGLHELIWIFETMAKDFKWSLESLNPMNSLQVSMMKMLKRKDIFSSDEAQISIDKKKSEIKKTETQKVEIKDWDGATKYIATKAPALAINLEHGNLLKTPGVSDNRLDIEFAYPEEGSVFFEIVNESSKKDQLITYIGEYFGLEKSNIHLKVELLKNDKEQDIGFKSKVKIRHEEEMVAENNQRESLLSNKYLKDVETLFNGKVSKVVLNDKEQ